MILLWRNAFPKNIKELDSEKARGDAFTWKVSLEGRAGALAVMHSFLEVDKLVIKCENMKDTLATYIKIQIFLHFIVELS